MLFLVVILLSECLYSTGGTDEYFGLPLGAMEIRKDIFVNVYLADSNTIVLSSADKELLEGYLDLSLMLWKQQGASENQMIGAGLVLKHSILDVPWQKSKKFKRGILLSDLQLPILSAIKTSSPSLNKTFSSNDQTDKAGAKKSRKTIFVKRNNHKHLSTQVYQPVNKVLLAKSETTTFTSSYCCSTDLKPSQQINFVIFILPAVESFNKYDWLGIWDPTLQIFTPRIPLNGIQAPSEEYVGSLKSSFPNDHITGEVHLLNCNTLLIKRFNIPTNIQKEVFFYVAVGVPGDHHDESLRCHVLGFPRNESLIYVGEADIIAILPDCVRTFDIDYFYVYDKDNGIILASIEIPSLLLPPCD